MGLAGRGGGELARTSTDIIAVSNKLKRYWAPRNDKFREWYKLVQMVDQLAQEKMESFVGPDPRASYNLLLHMLDSDIPHRLPPEDVTVDLALSASKVEEFYKIAWGDVYSRYRRTGRQSWLRDLIGYMLATGWYAVFAMVSQDGSRCIAEVWNPATVYPAWDDDLSECAHILDLTASRAQRLIARNNWSMSMPTNSQKLYDYWWLDSNNRVFNAIVLDTTLVKPETYEPRFRRIPIFTSPVGGLPDTGILSEDSNRWKEEVGQSCIATNENVYKYLNKWWTFTMQILRDTVQARIKEKSRGGRKIILPEDVFKRGAIFRMTPEEDVSFMSPPAIPIEIRSMQLDMEAMLQRGGPSWAMYGNIQQQLTAYVMSQISASANQIAKPFHQGIIDVLTDIDNFWWEQILNFGYKPYGKSIPKDLPKDIRITADYEIRIPGDLIQRATTARILDPDFRLSSVKVMKELFPEIKNHIEEKALVRADVAERHPIRAIISQIEAFREEARLLEESKDYVGSRLYKKAADKLESTLELEEQEAPPSRPPALPARRPETMPQMGTTPPAGIV